MRSHLFLASSIATLFLAAEKEPSGGGGGGTLKDQLTAARESVSSLEGEKSQLSTDLDAEKGKVSKLEGEKAQLSKDLKAAQDRVTALEGEKSQLTADLAKANGKITELQGTAKTADELATEKAAANGHVPTPTTAAQTGAKSKDGEALYAEYSKLTGRARGAFWEEHSKALIAYGESLEKAS